ncbi:MAG: hypothetical protein ACRD2B_10465, partial [Terriglobia bacterium]
HFRLCTSAPMAIIVGASSFWIYCRSSLPGPEEASPFHNITVSVFLTVGFFDPPTQTRVNWNTIDRGYH